jgi:erythritol transport system permease protein
MPDVTVESPTIARTGARRHLHSLSALLLRMRAALALLLLILAFSLMTDSFFTANNFAILIKHTSITALLAVGSTFVMLTGGIDLSVGSVAGLSGMVAGGIISQGVPVGGHVYYPSIWVAIAAALCCGALVGWLNGVLETKLAVPSFIATLGTLYIARGAALLSSNGRTFPGLAGLPARHNTGFTALGQGSMLGIPNPVWITGIIAVAAAVVAGKTVFGRHVYATGGNERAAVLAGISVKRVKVLCYIISGLCAAIVGLIIASELESAHPATGETFELTAIAAVVLGGASLNGGRGTIAGALLGACVIGVLADGLVMMGISEFWQAVIKGGVIILAVAIDQMQGRMKFRLKENA